jgi:GDP-L-fucose synthase
MNKADLILVTGASGLIGKALCRLLNHEGYLNVLTPTHKELDLTQQEKVHSYFLSHKPKFVFHLAGNVGGIKYNEANMAQLFYDNLMISSHVIHGSYLCGVEKLINFSSSCAYPPTEPQPYSVQSFGAAAPPQGNTGFAIAKVTTTKLCESYNRDFRCRFHTLIGANTFGPYDCFDRDKGHVIPSMLTKMILAKKSNDNHVILFGKHTSREFIYSEDLARAALFLMLNYDDPEPINVGSGDVVDMSTLAENIQELTQYRGRLQFIDEHIGATSRQVNWDPLKKMGWFPKTPFREGLKKTYEFALQELLGQ